MHVGRRGDTLIEVTIAIGIFSMIAIAVVAVMSSGTSGAQTALETTLTREEIDTQAEALRFIQTAYAVNKNDTETNHYAKLWKKIIGNAINMKEGTWTENRQQAVLQYHPNDCKELYNPSASSTGVNADPNSDIKDHAFVINPRMLGLFNPNSSDSTINLDSVYIPYSSNRLTEASIYPRLIYTNTDSVAGSQDALIDDTEKNRLWRAEGLYVIAVKDAKTTSTTGDYATGTGTTTQNAAFYDFYIRSCWYGTDANEPSTISTVIRLYDPDAIIAP